MSYKPYKRKPVEKGILRLASVIEQFQLANKMTCRLRLIRKVFYKEPITEEAGGLAPFVHQMRRSKDAGRRGFDSKKCI